VCLPAAWLAAGWGAGTLGPRPLTAVLHGLGDWAVWILLATLAISPARALLATPNIIVVRRMLGLAGLAYVAVHLVLYVADLHWDLVRVAIEIVLRFYLLIGFVALVGLGVLGWTSSDAWVKRLGVRWKRLHRLSYPVTALAVLHFVLQSKGDASRAFLAVGMFTWLMLWRAMPPGRDRGTGPLLGLALAAALLTLTMEVAWYSLNLHVAALRVLSSEADISFVLHPADQVLALGLLVALVAELRRLGLTRASQAGWFLPTSYAGGALAGLVTLWALNLVPDLPLDAPPLELALVAWMAACALLGLARRRAAGTPLAPWIDRVFALMVLLPASVMLAGTPQALLACLTLGGVAVLALGVKLWPQQQAGALLVAPLLAVIAYSAFLDW
jgi:sulfoxide reductase heme-binding subunit YedZ